MHGKCDSQRPEQIGSHHRQTGAGDTGVTLLELLAVLVIVSIMAALALPGLGTFSSRKSLSGQVDRLEALIIRVRDLAMEQGCPWRVEFDPGKGAWICYGDANGDLLMDPGEQRLGPDTLDGGVSFGCIPDRGPNNSSVPEDGVSFLGNRITFSPLGCCNAGSIYLKSKERSAAIRVMPASGSVRVWEYRDGWRSVK